CTTALMGRRYRRAPRSSDCAAGLPRGALLLQLANAGPILVRLGPERARELVVPVRLGVPALLLEAAAERVVRVVVDRRELEQLAELGFGLAPAPDPEVRDPERLADRLLVRLA